ncbi:aldo/keto reductase [Bariatricus sp. SGI.154]|uniref:aldo/keto reductase n=1 Tax=Bariatricus sp. SGI.154 TaxID=3420549 RepID=UPI003D00CFAD
MEYLHLNNGTKIPTTGIGTFLLQPSDAENAIVSALSNGYELIDTANAYMNEKAVGRGMKKSGLKREAICLSTKLWPSEYADADRAIDDTLKRLDTDYIDLLFLHQPIGDYIGAYQAMERTVKVGKVKSLGLSNFPIEKIQEIISVTEIKPAVLQVEAHPYYPQTALKEYLKDMGTLIMAWYPLGHGDHTLLNEAIFTELAEKYGKTTAQIILRWHTQAGNIVIPGSKNEAHIKDNINIFDFTLTEEEMQKIAGLDKDVRYYTATEEALQGYLAFAPDFDSQE